MKSRKTDTINASLSTQFVCLFLLAGRYDQKASL